MSEIKVILLCSTRFALPALQEMYFFKQLAVIAIPAEREELLEEVKALLSAGEIPVLRINKNSCASQLSEAIKQHDINTGLVMTFPYIVPASVYNLPAKGFYNVHPGPLPEYRGADPVFQQIKNREPRAGVTIHKLDDGLDTGDIVLREMIRLETTETHGLLTAKLSEKAALMVRVILKLIGFDMNVPSKRQNELKAVYHKRQLAKDISISWDNMDADSIVALMNACNPWNKGAVTKFNGKILRLLEGEKLIGIKGEGSPPGTVIGLDETGLSISTKDGDIIVVRIVYTDEGFFSARRLRDLGMATGGRFEPV